MNKKELVESTSIKTGYTKKEVANVIEAAVEVTAESLKKGDNIKLVGFGTLNPVNRKARIGRNPRKPQETIEIPACTGVVFKMSKELKERINQR